MTLDETSVGRLVSAAGYARATRLAVGVRTPSAVAFFAQGPGAGGHAVGEDRPDSDLGSSFAALAAADAAERMMTLSTLLLDALLAGAAV